MRMITMNVIRLKTSPEINVRLKSLGLRLMPTPLSVVTATRIIRQKHKKEDSTGDTNQLSTIRRSWLQLMACDPSPAKPAPIRAPTTVCVPDIGTPKKDELRMNRNEAIPTESIIWSCTCSVWLVSEGMMLLASFPATWPLHQKAPINSKQAPISSSGVIGQALLP